MTVLGVVGSVVAILGGVYALGRSILKDREDKKLKVRGSFHHEINKVTLEPRYETQGILLTVTYEGSRTIVLESIQFKNVSENDTHVMIALDPKVEMKQGSKYQKHLIAIDKVVEPASTAKKLVVTDTAGRDHAISKKEMKAIRKRALELVEERRKRRANDFIKQPF